MDLVVGEIVMSKYGTFPWWPSKIEVVEANRILVFFLASKKGEEKGWIPISSSSVKKWQPGKKFPIPKNYKLQLDRAYEEARLKLGETPPEDVCKVCGREGELVQCDRCEEWFHKPCQIGTAPVEEGKDWHCLDCIDKIRNELGGKFKNSGFRNDSEIQYYERRDPFLAIAERPYWEVLDDRFDVLALQSRLRHHEHIFIVKYRYRSEKDDQERIIRVKSTQPYLFGEDLYAILTHDKATFSEVRFYDVADDGWILFKDTSQFLCSKEKVVIRIMIFT